jgi:hypothetical protein
MSAPLSDDEQRLYSLAYFLCSCLAMKQGATGEANYTKIADRLSPRSELRKVVSRLLRYTPQDDSAPPDLGLFGKLTTGGLVELLVRLNQKLQEDYQNHREDYYRLLSPVDVLITLHKFVELTPQERQQLGLQTHGDWLTLLQRGLLILQTAGSVENYELIFRVYKAAVGLDFPNAESKLCTLDEVDALIAVAVNETLAYVPHRHSRQRNGEASPGRETLVEMLTLKAQREVRRLLVCSGNRESASTGMQEVNAYIQHYFQPGFVKKFAQTLVTNERLTTEFPIYLKHITIEATGPLPFADKAFDTIPHDSPYPNLLNSIFRDLEQTALRDLSLKVNDKALPRPGDYELASQESNRVTVEFYVKVPSTYEPAVNQVFARMASGDGQRIDFSLSSTGIGGALSHVIKVINRALLADVDCLRSYFAIAHDVTSTQTIMRDNVASPIWAHSLVKLCRKETVALALHQSTEADLTTYEALSFADPIGHGDYCGFDFLAAQAQAALQARLQAIRSAGVLPEQYVSDFCRQTEYTAALQRAWSYFHGYPFSTLAMMGTIEEAILKPLAAHDPEPTGEGDRPFRDGDPYVYADACLSIAEALLDEGIYRRAFQYLKRLDALDDYVQRELAPPTPDAVLDGRHLDIFSGALLVRYLICWAKYYYVYDPEDDGQGDYLPSLDDRGVNREGLVTRAWRTLEKADQHVERRLRKYVTINEVSQGTFHPHYDLLGQIAYLRAKILLFFARHVPYSKQYLPTDLGEGQPRSKPSVHWGRLFLMEKARLYAAADGNGERYACYAAMQSWVYLMMAATDLDHRHYFSLKLPDKPTAAFAGGRKELMDWAKTLRDHALIAYAETGRQCYYQIKEKSGLLDDYDDYGPYRVTKIKPIYEGRRQDGRSFQDDDSILKLDMSLLSIPADQLPKIAPSHPDRNIYLFGGNACYLFLCRGLYLLCSNQAEEFDAALITGADRSAWDQKLQQAIRLLNMAWAIAEEGGSLQPMDHEPTMAYKLVRGAAQDERIGRSRPGYSAPEVMSVRDLYPRRANEVADLGKIFSAACMVLRLKTTPADAHRAILEDIERILEGLHGAYRFSRHLREVFHFQERYNGHLSDYFERSRAILQQYQDHCLDGTGADDLIQCRDELLKELFGLM